MLCIGCAQKHKEKALLTFYVVQLIRMTFKEIVTVKQQPISLVTNALKWNRYCDLYFLIPVDRGTRTLHIGSTLIVAQYFLMKETRSVKRFFFLPLLVYFRNNNTVAPNLRVPLQFLKPFKNTYSLLLSDHCGSRRGTNTYCFRKQCALCLRAVPQCSIL